MSDPFLSEIRLMSFNYAPRGWAFCNGQFLPINQNQALFSLLGTTYGGNGQTTFALPDLRGRVPIGWGGGHALGQTGGAAGHVLNAPELPTHTHSVAAVSGAGNTSAPAGNLLASTSNGYGAPDQLTALDPAAAGVTGLGQAHTNMQPYAAVNFCIALVGIFPSQN